MALLETLEYINTNRKKGGGLVQSPENNPGLALKWPVKVFLSILLPVFFSCSDEKKPTEPVQGTPVLTTAEISGITYTEAEGGGTITSDGGAAITVRGVCWSTNPTPTIANRKTLDGAGSGAFVSNISGLMPQTTYYVRAYAINSHGAGYGDTVSFATPGFGEAFFPMEEGDTWYYTAVGSGSVIRTVSGDTTIEGNVCKKILHNGHTAQAWSKDTGAFYVHLINDSMYAIPPLAIPFSMGEGDSHQYAAQLRFPCGENICFIEISGSIFFTAYVTRQVPAGTFKATAQLHYLQDDDNDYNEFYAPGVGLLDDGDFVLDSANIGGVWFRP